ncbi:MAG: beta-galactosidase [Lachnospiraceae bacterium]|nr:beta-galactosidase [Lachnospiraceae bacterium]
MRNITLMTEARFAKQGEAMATIALPHTWNAFDGQDGGNDYWRGIGTYEIDLPNPTAGKKQYIELQGANHVATVYCNGRELGTHKGGFSTFRYDLTPAMKATGNVLTVVVSNAVSDIYPQTADFTFYGGLYRDVNFIEVNNAHFDLLKDGTAGVFVTPHCSGNTRLDLFPVNADDAFISVELKDADGNVVATGGVEASDHAHILIDLQQPHLWNGMADPYCYTAVAKIVKDDEILDTVEVTYGYRSFHVDPNTGFWLNGKNVPLRGVSRHQDRLDKGWAISKEDHAEDISLIKELGANTIRLAHYQHDQYFYDLCDKTGFALWAEIPFISKFIPSEEAYENTISQMIELVAQNYNHPSIFFWGIANEILIGADNEPLRKNLRDLNELAKSMDPSRLTTIAEVSGTPMNSEHVYMTDIVSYNHYFGWYGGDVAQNGPWFDKFHELNPSVALGVSEYGVENIVKWHSATPMNHDYTEEYASYYHHEMLKTFATRPYLWSTHVWNCFDFAADARNEGGVVGRNNKGLITYDRKLKKDAFYIYKAFWNPEPMVYIASRRFADRAPEERNVTVYTNADEVTLIVNGTEIETKAVTDHAVVFENVALNDGANTVTAKAGDLEDTITLNGVAEHNADYTLPDIAAAMAAGNWFDDIADNDDSEEIEVIDGYFSIEDTAGELLSNEECFKIVKGWFMKLGNLTMASMLTTLRDMMGFRKISEFSTIGGEISAKDMAQLNRQLIKIKK